MEHEERNAVSALISGVVTFMLFGRDIWEGTVAGTYDTDQGLSLWAWDVLWLIGGGIVVCIVVLIAFQILYAIATNTENPTFVTDERDHMISRRGSLVTLFVISASFLIAVVMLSQNWGPLAAFNTILLGMFAGSMFADIYRVAVYRLGL